MTKINNVQKSVKSSCLTSNFSFFWFLRLEVQPTSVSDICVLYFLPSSFFQPNISWYFWPSSDSSPFFFLCEFFQATMDCGTVSLLLGVLTILSISSALIKILPQIFLVCQVTNP